MNKLMNIQTGEIIDLKKSSPKEITEALSMIIIKRKELEEIEKKVKKHIKDLNLDFEENTNGVLEAQFGLARVRKSYRESFDRKKLDLDGSEKEKKIMELSEQIKKKYTRLTEILTIS